MIYLSGKITGTSDYEERFSRIEKQLCSLGHKVVNPVRIGKRLEKQLGREPTYEEYIKADLHALSDCDTIILLEGWEESNGACHERQYAELMGIRIIEGL